MLCQVVVVFSKWLATRNLKGGSGLELQAHCTAGHQVDDSTMTADVIDRQHVAVLSGGRKWTSWRCSE